MAGRRWQTLILAPRGLWATPHVVVWTNQTPDGIVDMEALPCVVAVSSGSHRRGYEVFLDMRYDLRDCVEAMLMALHPGAEPLFAEVPRLDDPGSFLGGVR